VIWPPDALWSRIAALWAHAHGAPGTSAGEQAKAFAALEELKSDFDLSDIQIAYMAEFQMLDPSSRIVRRERAENAFEIVLATLDNAAVILPTFEFAVTVAAWVLHTYVFDRFIHTPRLLVHSREPGCGKTALFACVEGMANNAFRDSAVTPAVIYHQLLDCPRTTLLLDEIEHSTLWKQHDPIVAIIDTGHRQGGYIPRVIRGKVVRFPTFAPLALAPVFNRRSREKFPLQIVSRSISLELVKRREGRDEIFSDDPRFPPIRAIINRWAETFQRSKTIILPQQFHGRTADNWRVLIAIGDALGYGATVRAAAIAVEAASFDPELRFYGDIFDVFEKKQVDRFWTSELVQALREIEHGLWAALTNDAFYDRLYRKGIDYRTVWKVGADGTRRSNKGFYREQFEPVWRDLLGHTETQSSKIIRLPRHKRGTGGAHGD
jgi:hypothetical protein